MNETNDVQQPCSAVPKVVISNKHQCSFS